MRLISKDFYRGNTCVRENAEDPGKDGEPSDHNASLTLSEGEREGRLGTNVQDCCAVQERLNMATGAKARFYVRLVTCLPDVPFCAESLNGSSLWEA